MKKYYTIEEMTDFLDSLAPDTDVIEDAGHEGIVDAIHARLTSQQQHIEWMRGRLALAEHVIGELYLMQREYEE
jgi:hypothetical protein